MKKYKKIFILLILVLFFLIIPNVSAQEIEETSEGKRFFEVGITMFDDDVECISNICSNLPIKLEPNFYYGFYFKGLASPKKNSSNVYLYYEYKYLFTTRYILQDTEVQNIRTTTTFGIRGYY